MSNFFSRLAVIFMFMLAATQTAFAFEPGRATHTLGVKSVQSDLTIQMATVMPGETLTIRSVANATASTGVLTKTAKSWTWQAPQTPGHSVIKFEQNGDIISLNVFILTPFVNGQQKALNGYKIGRYSSNPFKGLSNYKAPRGFIEVTPALLETRISPHFKLKQFLCKQQPGHDPTYVLVNPALLVKLETLLEAANAKGWNAESFHLMSGFRTPHYNASIGNKTTSSRHLFGGAADIWIDGDGDGRMDDLNGDGKYTKDDARKLAALAETLAKKGGSNWPAGGVGIYGANAAHGPFVHIDARGYRARWGQ